MLEFNQNHKSADLSAIKNKTTRAKKAGKIMLAGIALSAMLLLSGCESEPSVTETPPIESTAIIMENGNAVIIDLQSYQKYQQDIYGRWIATGAEKIMELVTSDGDKILVDYDSVKIITSENAHQKAETIAQSLISENGQITCYDEVTTYGKTR